MIVHDCTCIILHHVSITLSDLQFHLYHFLSVIQLHWNLMILLPVFVSLFSPPVLQQLHSVYTVCSPVSKWPSWQTCGSKCIYYWFHEVKSRRVSMTWRTRDISPIYGDFVSMSTAKQCNIYTTLYNRDQLWSIELFWSWENQQVNWKTIRGWCYLGKRAMFTLFTVCWTILEPDGTGIQIIQLNRATLREPGRCPPKALFASTAKHHPPGALWPMGRWADGAMDGERAMAALRHCNTLLASDPGGTLKVRCRFCNSCASSLWGVAMSHDKPWPLRNSH